MKNGVVSMKNYSQRDSRAFLESKKIEDDIRTILNRTIEDMGGFSTEDTTNEVKEKASIRFIGQRVYEKLEFEITNNSSQVLTYGSLYTLEEYTDNEWEKVPELIDNYAFDEVLSTINPNESDIIKEDYRWLYGKLDPNREYRIVKEVFFDTDEHFNIATPAFSGIEDKREPVSPDIERAVREELEKFKENGEVELLDLWYNKEDCEKEIDSYITSGRGADNGIKRENVMVVLSDFKTKVTKGDTYLNYMDINFNWILIRNDENSPWKVDDYGY